MYLLLEPLAFAEPPDPGNTAVYPQFSPTATIKMIDAEFTRDKNYYLSFKNIHRTCFKMLDDSISNQFKVSNTPNLTGWNSTMTILVILDQLEASYGKPDTMTLFGNDTLFRSPFPANEAPEMLFYRIEQCQEIQILAQDPYTPTQIINNAVCLLQQSGIFPLKEFDTALHFDSATNIGGGGGEGNGGSIGSSRGRRWRGRWQGQRRGRGRGQG
jgi:hypothetical protein